MTAPPTTPTSVRPAPPCAICGYDLGATVAAGLDRCPECGWMFSDDDLRLLGPSNIEGQPRSFRPGEKRLPGSLVLATMALFLGMVFVLAVLLAYWRSQR